MKNISALILATFIWGSGFVATRWTLVDFSPTWSNSFRFLFAGAISFPILLLFDRKLLFNRKVLICSLFLFLGLQLQTFGIAYTTIAKSGFFTVMYSVFTPIFLLLFFKQKIRAAFWFLLGLSLLAIALICDFSLENFNAGDVLIIISAIFFSLHIISVDRLAHEYNSFTFNLGQCFTVGIIGLIYALFTEGVPSNDPFRGWGDFSQMSPVNGFLILSIFSSIIAFGLQNYSQKKIKAHIVGLIFLLESFFAAGLGYLLYNETLTQTALIGCSLLCLTIILIPKLTKFNKPVPA
ncbi:DMT family transporter [Bacteriovoracaceae bacterium]|nr:DMT family transporter [Bacteriovoracaceae bacterium]